jgi:HEPN domain-containing protein
MNNKAEIIRKLRDAEVFLKDAEIAFANERFRACTQNAQICIEICAKAVISHYSEPEWTHDPSQQLKQLLNAHKDKLIKELGEEMFKRLNKLASDSKIAAPWHGKAVYGEEVGDSWVAAAEICTEAIASNLLELAQCSFSAARDFFNFLFQ